MLGSCQLGTRTILCPRPARVAVANRLVKRSRPLFTGARANAASVGSQTQTSTSGNGGSATGPQPNVKQGSTPSPGGSIQDTPPLLPPAGILAKAVEIGTAKANLPAAKCFALSIMGGIFISFGGALAVTVGPNCPGLAQSNPGLLKMVTGLNGLPFGLLLVMCCGAELFTGNVALVATAVFNGKATWKQLVQNWSLSYTGNMIGTLIVIFLMTQGAVFPQQAPGPISMATPKVGLTFSQAFFRACLANWFVCLATWLAIGSNSLISKISGIYLTISSFVAIGLEHSVANMFIIPFAITLGADITTGTYLFKNLLPVTLGNICGGAIGVAAFYSYVYGTLGQKTKQA